MKKTRRLVFLAILMTVLAGGTRTAAAQKYLGEFCWGYHDSTQNIPCPDCPVTPTPGLKAGVTHLGGAYYLLQGQVGPLFFLQATGVIVGDDIWLNGSTTQDLYPTVPLRTGGVIQARLSLSTLSGPFWRITTDFNTSDGLFGEAYIAGALTFGGACP